jgi:hypothetical protein
VPGAATTPPPDTPPAIAARLRLQTGPADKIQTTYKQLSEVAVHLNTFSDELGKPIKVWETALKKLNLGVPAWVAISEGGEDPWWWDRGIGYIKLKDHWGVALRRRSGDYTHADHDEEEVWAFNEAPRWMRIDGVGKLPDLLDALLKQAEETINKLKAKITQANVLAEAISAAADELAALTEES